MATSQNTTGIFTIMREVVET